MEVLQVQSSATLVDAQLRGKQHQRQNVGSSVYASLSLKPHNYPAVGPSWGRRNVLVAKIPVVGARDRKSSRPVTLMASMLTNKVYADAMMHLGQTQGNLDAIYKDFKNVSKYFDDKETMKFFKRVTIRPEQKKKVIELFEEVYKIQEGTKNFLLIMNDKYRLPDVPAIIAEFDKLYYKHTETVVATVSSFKELSDAEQEAVVKRVQELSKAKNVILKTKVDRKLLGGYRVFWGSSMIDETVRGRLNDIIDIMKKTPYPAAELEPLPPQPKLPEPLNIESKVNNTIERFRKQMEEDSKEADKVAEVASEVAKKALYDNAKPLDALAAIERETAKVRAEWVTRKKKETEAYVRNSQKKLEEARAFVAKCEEEFEEHIASLSIPPPPGFEVPGVEVSGADGGVREPVTVGATESEAE